ncbi:MAG: 2-hydroxyacyl-CoA dehydratase family protein [Cyanobacteria bacterium]|nr:2-hydroxyacyl-CoA dehydratase family protein [Cyanobacteriota bacterium]
MQINNKDIIEKFFQESVKTKQNIKNDNFIGYLCSYIPEEILISGGLNAIRIKGDKESNLADGYMPINFCPYIKAVWEETYKKTNNLNPIVFATSCDGMKRLYDLFLNYKKDSHSFILDIPKKNDKISYEFFAGRLKRFLSFVKKISPDKEINEYDLIKSIEIINKKRYLLSELTKIYEADLINFISTSQYFDIIDLSLSTNNEIFNNELEIFLKNAKNTLDSDYSSLNRDNLLKNNQKIMVIGNYLNDKNFWDIFTESGIKVVSGDLCISSRYFDFQVELKNIIEYENKENFLKSNHEKYYENNIDNLLKIIAASYLKKPYCFRMASLNEKLETIKNKIITENIKAVIFASLKFCDNTLYFYPELKSELTKLNIPSLYLDIDYGNSSSGQLRTRIEAFCEMLF